MRVVEVITAPRPHGLDPLAEDGVKQSMRE